MLRFKDFEHNEGMYVDTKGNVISDERDHATYEHSPDADTQLMAIKDIYGDSTFETNLFDHLLHRKFRVTITNKDAYHSLATALRDRIIDEKDVEDIYHLANSKDLDARNSNCDKLIQYIDDLKKDSNYDFDKLRSNIGKIYKLNMQPSLLDTLEEAMKDGKMDIIDLRNLYNSCESPIYFKRRSQNENKKFPKASDYTNMADDVVTFKIDGDKIEKVDMEEYEIVKVVDMLSPKEVEKIQEMQVLNLGTTMPKDIKRGDQLYLTVMLQPKNKTATAYNVTNTMGVVRVRVMDIYQGLNILKNKGIL